MGRKPGGGYRAPRDYHPRETNQKRASRGTRRRFTTPQPSDRASRIPHPSRRSGEKTSRVRESARPGVDTMPSVHHVPATQGAQQSFADLGVGPRLCTVLRERGAKRPFAIQAATIPPALAGHDVLGKAATGSGKTIAFGVSVVERLLALKAAGEFAHDPPSPHLRRGRAVGVASAKPAPARKPKAIILAPTRELALQIDETVQAMTRVVGLYTTQLVGGASLQRQQTALRRGIDIVIGTPGRVIDLVNRGDLTLDDIRIAVVDEADHLSELGFLESVQRILRLTPRSTQMMLFSATLDGEVAELVHEFSHDPKAFAVDAARGGDLTHHVLMVFREHKDEVLVQLARPRTLMFVRTREGAERDVSLLQGAGVAALALHGNLTQAQREDHLGQFARGAVDVLVATDVAARGIHIDDLAAVVQADPPDDPKTYVHRSGRTARAGQSGVVYTVIPRTRQQRMRRLLDEAGITPASFAGFAPGDPLPSVPRS